MYDEGGQNALAIAGDMLAKYKEPLTRVISISGTGSSPPHSAQRCPRRRSICWRRRARGTVR
jgi:hypothetical protein